MSTARTFGSVLVALALTLSAGIARSAPPVSDDARARAITRLQRGQEPYADRDFAGALSEFRKAYELAPSYRLLYDIGQVCYQMHDYVCAQQSRARLGYLDLQVDVARAEVSVDDVLAGVAPLAQPITGVLALDAGRDVRSKLYDDTAAADANRSRASSLALASDAFIIGAALTLTATTVLTFVLPRSSSKKVGLTVTPGRIDEGFSF